MKKQIACPNCKGKGNIILTRKYDDYCGIGSVMCEVCGGTGLHEADMTNADRIRAMNNYELAVFLAMVKAMVYRADLPVIAYSTQDMADNLEWLQQPVEEPPC